MSKVYFFAVMITGLMILLSLSGINTTTGYVLSQLGLVSSPENIANTNFYQTIFLLLTIGVFAGGVVIGFFTKSSPEGYLLAPFAAILMLFVGDMVSVISYVNSTGVEWTKWLVTLIIAPLIIGYIISVVSWWGQRE